MTTRNVIAADELMIITNSQTEANQLSAQQVKQIYMGFHVNLPSAVSLKPASLPIGERSRIIFNTRILGLTESRIQSYWAQMRFSGRKKPPQEVETNSELLALISNTPNIIAFVPSDITLTENIKVLYNTAPSQTTLSNIN